MRLVVQRLAVSSAAVARLLRLSRRSGARVRRRLEANQAFDMFRDLVRSSGLRAQYA